MIRRTKIFTIGISLLPLVALVIFYSVVYYFTFDIAQFVGIGVITALFMITLVLLLNIFINKKKINDWAINWKKENNSERNDKLIEIIFVCLIIFAILSGLFGIHILDRNANKYWSKTEANNVGIAINDDFIFNGQPHEIETKTDGAFWRLAINSSSCKFVLTKVEGDKPSDLPNTFAAKIDTKPKDWNNEIKDYWGNSDPDTDMPVKGIIEVPNCTLAKPIKIFGHLDSIDVTYPYVNGVGSFAEKSAKIASREVSFWLVPQTFYDTLKSDHQIINKWNDVLIIIVILHISLLASMIQLSKYIDYIRRRKFERSGS